jgi:hypothetical protein
MNNRIEKLAFEAKQFARAQMAHPMDPAIFSASVFEKKFAELIIKETLETALYGDEHEQARANVRQLFGVNNG